MPQSERGFTIVELIVVVLVIGILLGLTLPNLFSAQARARDDTRKNDLRNLQQSLETYYNDNISYPTTAETLSVLAPEYINTVPSDPKGGGYIYESDGNSYALTADLENNNDQHANDSGNYVLDSVNQ